MPPRRPRGILVVNAEACDGGGGGGGGVKAEVIDVASQGRDDERRSRNGARGVRTKYPCTEDEEEKGVGGDGARGTPSEGSRSAPEELTGQ